MKILVFGGSGFLGSHACLQLMNDGHQLDIVIRSPLSRKSLLLDHSSRFKTIEWSRWTDIAFRDYECVLVMIGGVSARATEVEIDQANYQIPKEIFKKADQSGAKHFVFISSVASRSENHGSYTEETGFKPRATRYAQSKMEIEKQLMEYQGPMLTTILSPCFLVGEGDIHVTSSVVFLQLRMGRLKTYPSGFKTISHPSDVASAISIVIKNKIGGLFLLGGFRISYEDLFKIATQKMGLSFQMKLDPQWQPSSVFEREFFDASEVNDAKARSQLGYEPKITAMEMIERAVRSLKENKLIP